MKTSSCQYSQVSWKKKVDALMGLRYYIKAFLMKNVQVFNESCVSPVPTQVAFSLKKEEKNVQDRFCQYDKI